MLEKLKTLRESITDEQRDALTDILGKDMKRLFFRALMSDDEEVAEKRIKKFSTALGKEPLKAFKLYKKMTKEQKAIVQEFMED